MKNDGYLKTPEVAKICNRTVNSVIKYAKELGIHEKLLRTHRGDYLFTIEQSEAIRVYSISYVPQQSNICQ